MNSQSSAGVPHGQTAFGERQTCDCTVCQSYRNAVRRLIASFSQIPSRWVEALSQQLHLWVPLPMWGTLFLPMDEVDRRGIERLLGPMHTSNEELEALSDAGWQEIAETGVLAIEFDDELVLGIHGAGYSFYDQHWSRLYDALGYHWHEN